MVRRIGFPSEPTPSRTAAPAAKPLRKVAGPSPAVRLPARAPAKGPVARPAVRRGSGLAGRLALLLILAAAGWAAYTGWLTPTGSPDPAGPEVPAADTPSLTPAPLPPPRIADPEPPARAPDAPVRQKGAGGAARTP
jgi:hypothetical protein